jgi:hypothetical protein
MNSTSKYKEATRVWEAHLMQLGKDLNSPYLPLVNVPPDLARSGRYVGVLRGERKAAEAANTLWKPQRIATTLAMKATARYLAKKEQTLLMP